MTSFIFQSNTYWKVFQVIGCVLVIAFSFLSNAGYAAAESSSGDPFSDRETQQNFFTSLSDTQVAQASGLVPGGETNPDGELGDPCGYSDLIELINNVIERSIVILTSLGTLLFLYAGFLYLTAGSDSGQTEDAKEILTNVAIGFGIVLLAVTLVTTLVTELTDDDWRDTWGDVLPLIELSYKEPIPGDSMS